MGSRSKKQKGRRSKIKNIQVAKSAAVGFNNSSRVQQRWHMEAEYDQEYTGSQICGFRFFSLEFVSNSGGSTVRYPGSHPCFPD